MTTDIRPKGSGEAISDLSKRLYKVEQRGSSPGSGTGGLGSDPVVNTITVDGIVVGSTASPATNLTLSSAAFMEDIWIDADWDAPGDGTAASYDVELSRKVGLSYELVNNFRTSGTSIRMSGLEPSQTYGVRVVAINRIAARSTPLPSSGFTDVTTGIDATVPDQVSNFQLVAGIRTVMATWNEVADRDVARGTGTYEVELATDSGFTAIFASKFTSATITSFSGVASSTTYWGRVRAVDNSGNAGAWSTSASIATVPAGTGDIGTGAVQTTNIANLAVGNAQIANLAVDDAKVANLSADKLTTGTLDANRIAANTIDVNKLTASTLTSKVITIGTGGTLKIGNAPTTGIFINDQGIRLYSGGSVKVALDVTGTASFEGNISASTITSSTITSVTINSGTITGTTVRTAASGERIAMEAGVQDQLKFYTGDASELLPGMVTQGASATTMELGMFSPRDTSSDYMHFRLAGQKGTGVPVFMSLDMLNSSGGVRAYIEFSAATSSATPRVIMSGVSDLYLPFAGGATSAQLRGSGNYAFLYLFGGGPSATLNVVLGLGAGMSVLDGNNGAFQPLNASAFNVSSARKVKSNIRGETESALDKISRASVVRYNRDYGDKMKGAPSHIQRMYDMEEVGLIADDLLSVAPEAVVMGADGPIGINLAVLVALLVKGVQELSGQIVMKGKA